MRKAGDGITLVDITIPGQLGKTQSNLEALARELKSHLTNGSDETSSEICHIRTRRLLVDINTATRDEDLLRALVGQELGLKDPTCLGFINPGHGAFLVHVQSKRKDTVVRSIHKNLREATKVQFTKARPACLVARFIDLDIRQLHNVANQQGPTREASNALQLMANSLFARRDYLQSVFYLSGDIQVATRASLIFGGGRVSSDSAPMYMFNSRDSRFAQLFPRGL